MRRHGRPGAVGQRSGGDRARHVRQRGLAPPPPPASTVTSVPVTADEVPLMLPLLGPARLSAERWPLLRIIRNNGGVVNGGAGLAVLPDGRPRHRAGPGGSRARRLSMACMVEDDGVFRSSNALADRPGSPVSEVMPQWARLAVAWAGALFPAIRRSTTLGAAGDQTPRRRSVHILSCTGRMATAAAPRSRHSWERHHGPEDRIGCQTSACPWPCRWHRAGGQLAGAGADSAKANHRPAAAVADRHAGSGHAGGADHQRFQHAADVG